MPKARLLCSITEITKYNDELGSSMWQNQHQNLAITIDQIVSFTY